MMGGLSPLATALFAAALLGQSLRDGAVPGSALMVGGAFVMCLSDRVEWRRIVLPAIAAGATAGLANVLQNSKANPAIVDAISGLRYAVIFALSLLLTKARPGWLKEEFAGRALAIKCIGTAAVVTALVLAGGAGQ